MRENQIHQLSRNFTIRKSLQELKKLKKKSHSLNLLVFIDKNQILKGIITEGDLERYLLEGYKLDDRINNLINKNPIKFYEEDGIENIEDYVLKTLNKKKIKYKISHVVVVNKKNQFKYLYKTSENAITTFNYKKNVSVIGLGYVGLTFCLNLSNYNFNKIYGLDINKKIIEDLKKSRISFYEQGLDPLLKYSNKNKKIEFINGYINLNSDIYIICVNTPPKRNFLPDLKSIISVTNSLSKKIKKGDLIIIRSTLPVGTTKNTIIPILKNKVNLVLGEDYYLSIAPERLVEGNALEEQKNLPQIIGAVNIQSLNATQNFFDLLNVNTIKVNTIEEAEIIKLANNTFRDHVFSFSNSLSFICNQYNINTNNLIKKANEGYPRDKIPLASPGVGGICLSKDPFFYDRAINKRKFSKVHIGKNSRKINSMGAKFLFRYLKKFKDYFYKNSSINVFIIGLAFKGFPETSDIRFSTSIDFINEIKKNKYNYLSYDVNSKIIKFYNNASIKYSTLDKGFKNSNSTFVINNHPSYSNLDLQFYLSNKKRPYLFFDAWGLYDQNFVEQFDNVYYGTLGYITPFDKNVY